MRIGTREIDEETLAVYYKRVFNTEEGQIVLTHLQQIVDRHSIDLKKPEPLLSFYAMAQNELLKTIWNWSRK